MATAIPDEAIEKFRVLERRAEAARALSESLRERIDRYNSEVRDYTVNLHDFYRRAAVKGRIVIQDDGTIEHHVEGRDAIILATANPTAARLKRGEAAIARTRKEQAEAHEAASPIFQLTAACLAHLKSIGWDGL